MASITESGTDITIRTSTTTPTPDAPWTMVSERFDLTMQYSEEMLERLVGPDGESGYLGELNETIQAAPVIDIPAPEVDASIVLVTSGLTPPSFDDTDLAEFPDETYAAPVLEVLPVIDSTGIDGVVIPDAPNAALNWSSTLYSSAILQDILDRLSEDLQNGATGLEAVVEEAIYDRARARQQVDRLAEYNRINDTVAQLQHQMPSGVLLSALTDYGIGADRQDADIENQIIVTQAELAQKNAQFVLQQSLVLEQLIRGTYASNEDRALDYRKAQVDVLIKDYAERVRAYVSTLEGEKAKIQAQVEVLKGVIEGNRAAVDLYKEQYAALAVRVGAVASQNESMVKVFQGEVQGYSETERAIAAQNESATKVLIARVQAAELDLKAAVADAEQTVAAYSAEMSLRERVATAMANIASQSVASWASAVNTSAGLSYQASESKSEQFQQSKSINVQHQYEHAPVE